MEKQSSLSRWRDTCRPVIYQARFCCLSTLAAVTALRIYGVDKLAQRLEFGVALVTVPVGLFLTCDHLERSLYPKSRWKCLDKASKSIADFYRLAATMSYFTGLDLGLNGQIVWWVAKGQRIALIAPIKLGIVTHSLVCGLDRNALDVWYDALTALRYSIDLFHAWIKSKSISFDKKLYIRMASLSLLAARLWCNGRRRAQDIGSG